MTAMSVFQRVRTVLELHRFVHRREETFQDHVVGILDRLADLDISTEVIDAGGRYDVLVATRYEEPPIRVVLELKLRCSLAAIERQAQRYALNHGVDGVALVTTSRRLASGLRDLRELGGKPFAVIALRAW